MYVVNTRYSPIPRQKTSNQLKWYGENTFTDRKRWTALVRPSILMITCHIDIVKYMRDWPQASHYFAGTYQTIDITLGSHQFDYFIGLLCACIYLTHTQVTITNSKLNQRIKLVWFMYALQLRVTLVQQNRKLFGRCYGEQENGGCACHIFCAKTQFGFCLYKIIQRHVRCFMKYVYYLSRKRNYVFWHKMFHVHNLISWRVSSRCMHCAAMFIRWVVGTCSLSPIIRKLTLPSQQCIEMHT